MFNFSPSQLFKIQRNKIRVANFSTSPCSCAFKCNLSCRNYLMGMKSQLKVHSVILKLQLKIQLKYPVKKFVIIFLSNKTGGNMKRLESIWSIYLESQAKSLFTFELLVNTVLCSAPETCLEKNFNLEG